MSLIGVTGRGYYAGEIVQALRNLGVDALELASPFDFNYDGFVLAGGPDVNPRLYGSDYQTYFDRERDALEIEVLDHAEINGIPVMGICRGHQMIAVYAGIPLIPDISGRHAPFAENGLPFHPVYTDEEFSGMEKHVNSLHHQAVPNNPALLAKAGFEVRALSDNVVNSEDREIVEAMTSPNSISVQWHPEIDWESSEISKFAFQRFLEMLND